MAASINVYMKNEDSEPKIIGTPKILKKFSKKMSKSDGTIMYFVQKDYGVKNGLMSKMNFRTIHPVDTSFCEITIEIERY